MSTTQSALFFALFYFLIKLLFYSGWCWVGLNMMKIKTRSPRSDSLVYGIIRLSLGAVFGFLIALASYSLDHFFSSDANYFSKISNYTATYIPFRWIEWSIMICIINPRLYSFKDSLLNLDRKLVYFRVGGIIISCLADLPIIILYGVAPEIVSDILSNLRLEWLN